MRPEHSFFTRAFWPAILGLDGVRPSTAHIDYLDSRFTRVHCTVDVGGFPYVPSGVSLLTGLVAWGLSLASSGASPLLTLPFGLSPLPSSYWVAHSALALGGVWVGCAVLALTLFALGLRTFLSEARPFTSALTVTAVVVGVVYAALGALLAHPAYASVSALPGIAVVPTGVVWGVSGGVLGYIVGSSLKAPFYYYVAQKK